MVYVLLFFIYGLVVGSFCNVVISRLRTGENMVFQRSHCPQCMTPIGWRDNVPVLSYLLLGGKCRSCKKPISRQYPFVEIVTAVIFASVGLFYVQDTVGYLLVAVIYAFAFAHLMVIFVYDGKYMEIPMFVMWMCIGLFVVANIVMDLNSDVFATDLWGSVTVMHGLSALVAFGFFFGLSYISDETWMGYGDAFIALAMGLLLGPIGTFVAMLIAFCVGAVYGVGLMIIQKKSSKTEIPFGPFLIFGMYCAFVLQNVYPEFFALLV